MAANFVYKQLLLGTISLILCSSTLRNLLQSPVNKVKVNKHGPSFGPLCTMLNIFAPAFLSLCTSMTVIMILL